MATRLFVATLLVAGVLSGQGLEGVIDIHVHGAPDVVPRSADVFELTRLAAEQGLRAIVLKNHYEPTASLAELTAKLEPGIEVYGGIVLNRPVGGVNPASVERMARLPGRHGRVVWMPTFDAENHVRGSGEDRPSVSVARDGQLLPAVVEVIDLIARHDLVLATGHSSPDEGLQLIREARKRRVQRILVTHAMLAPVEMNIDQMKTAASLGAQIEFVYNALIGSSKMFEIADYTRAIRALGPEHAILSSDLGQAANPLPTAGLATFLAEMRKQGFSLDEIDLMVRRNPARLLGLE